MKPHIRWWLLLSSIPVIALTGILGIMRLHINTDIGSMMPRGDRIVDDASFILHNHPALDKVVVDLSLEGGKQDPEALVEAASLLSLHMKDSGLFLEVGSGSSASAMAALYKSLPKNLPAFFNARELQGLVAPRLSPQSIHQALQEALTTMSGLEGIGQAEFLAEDPLGLRNIVAGRLGQLIPTPSARFYKQHILTADSRHLLLVSAPKSAGSDTGAGARLDTFMRSLPQWMAANGGAQGKSIHLEHMGSYRASLDNERSIRADVQLTSVLSTLGIILLAWFCFRRPWVGVVSYLPALAGICGALFIISLFQSSLSALALGFGGALISIAVDSTISFCFFLDSNRPMTGKEAAHALMRVGLFNVLTTMGAFLMLSWSGFPVLAEVGVFSALGVGICFVFVHTIFRWTFVEMAPARREPKVNLVGIMTWLDTLPPWVPSVFIVAGVAFAFSPPPFNTDMAAMNGVSPETLAAENSIKAVWGDFSSKVSLFAVGRSLEELHRQTDKMLAFIEGQQTKGAVMSAFSPSEVAPGALVAERNTEAWKAFWTPGLVASVSAALETQGEELGFAPNAFAPFLATITHPQATVFTFPEDLNQFLGITRSRDGTLWMASSLVETGPGYEGATFATEATGAGFHTFDASLFGARLAGVLSQTFPRMILWVGGSALLVLVFLLMEPVLLLLALGPMVFGLTATLGTLSLLGHPLNVPDLMLVVVVLGMGVDFGIFVICAYQKYFSPDHPSLGPISANVFLAAGTTLAGLGGLMFATHPLLKSAGLTTTLSVAYSLLAALSLPPILKRLFAVKPFPSPVPVAGSAAHRKAFLRRFQYLDAHPRLFARFKYLLDPMFPRLAEFVPKEGTILDIGCGYGIPSAWLLTAFDQLRVIGWEPDPERVDVARRVVGERGTIEVGAAPNLPAGLANLDAGLMLDMGHYLDDAALQATLRALYAALKPGGRLIMRITIPRPGFKPLYRRWEEARMRWMGLPRHYRDAESLRLAITKAGFQVETVEPTAAGREETWFRGTKP